MTRTITVKGVGSISVPSDQVVLTLQLEAKDLEYDAAMSLASKQIGHLERAVVKIGFAKGSLKTTDFNVTTSYEHEKDALGNYHSVFDGYVVAHSLKLAFDFETRRLSEVLSAIGSCPARPEMNIAFTVKNPSGVHELLLRDAAKNARLKAEVLSDAAGVTLGQLLTVDYNWFDINVFSRTRLQDEVLMSPMKADASFVADIEPEDINVHDTATFVWEIE